MVQSDLLKRTGRTLKRIKKFPVLFLKYGRKISLEECSIFGNVACWNSFSKVSLHFNKMNNSSRKLLQTYSEKCIFYVIQHIVFLKQSVVAALEVLRESWKLSWMKFILQLLCIVSTYPHSPIQTLPSSK